MINTLYPPLRRTSSKPLTKDYVKHDLMLIRRAYFVLNHHILLIDPTMYAENEMPPRAAIRSLLSDAFNVSFFAAAGICLDVRYVSTVGTRGRIALPNKLDTRDGMEYACWAHHSLYQRKHLLVPDYIEHADAIQIEEIRNYIEDGFQLIRDAAAKFGVNVSFELKGEH